ncbi:MAG TPA: PAS domain S-box protein [Halobacteria archaeon]|nr:PAS domain S-box protein [Halobacteria archaeon]
MENMIKRLDEYLNNPIIKFSPTPITVLTPTGFRIGCNPAMERFAERNKDELIDKPIELIYADESKDTARKLIEDAVKNDFAQYELILLKRDGNKVPVIASASSIKEDDGEVIGVVYTASDITELKRKEEYLDRSRKQYSDLVENVNSIVLCLDNKGIITFFNRYAEELFGYSREEIIGREIVGTIVPERESTNRDLRRLFSDILKNPDKYNINENISKDGRRFWISWTNRPIYDAKMGLAQLLSIGNDVTALISLSNKLESTVEYLESILDYYPDTLLILDKKNNVQFISPRFEEDFGYKIDVFKNSSVDVLIEKIVPTEERDVAECIKESILIGKRFTSQDIELISKNGDIINASCSGSALINKKTGKIIGTVISIRDLEREYKEYVKVAKMFVDEYEKNNKRI